MALVLGVFGDSLLREAPWGLNATLWLGVLVLGGIALRSRGILERARGAGWPLTLAALAAVGFSWRDSPTLVGLFALLFLTFLSLSLLRKPLGSGLGLHATAGAAAVLSPSILMTGILSTVDWRDMSRPGLRRRTWTVARGSLLAMPLLLALGGLFASADPLFRRYLGEIFFFSLEDLVTHSLLIVALAWVAGGTLQGLGWMALGAPKPLAPHRDRWIGEVLIALLLVDLLFIGFLLVQARSLFGGRALVETTIDLSYADYAREGFFQLVAAAALVLPALLAADWMVPSGSTHRLRFQMLAGALLLMVGAVLVSAAARMRLYTDVYGWTELRIYTSAFMAWLALVFAWCGATALPGRRKRFAAGAIASGTAVVLTLAALNPDATIVRVNAARAESRDATPGFDGLYAASLSADAVPTLVRLLPTLRPLDRCIVADRLIPQWLDDSTVDWRTWNWSRSRAQRVVAARESALREALGTCPASLEAPETVLPGAYFAVTWTGPAGEEDRIEILRPSSGTEPVYFSQPPRWNPVHLSAPQETGRYEIRYLHTATQRILARRPIEVGAPTPPPPPAPEGADSRPD